MAIPFRVVISRLLFSSPLRLLDQHQSTGWKSTASARSKFVPMIWPALLMRRPAGLNQWELRGTGFSSEYHSLTGTKITASLLPASVIIDAATSFISLMAMSCLLNSSGPNTIKSFRLIMAEPGYFRNGW